MNQINNWINDLLLVLFPADSEMKEEGETKTEKPMVNFVVLVLLLFT